MISPGGANLLGSRLLKGKNALVTGAARGLGASISTALSSAGANVLRVDVAGDDCFLADVSTAEGNDAMIAETLRRFGSLDILVLNAGLQRTGPIATYREVDWDLLHGVMLKGPFLALRSAWEHLARRSGRVVVVSSTSAFAADPDKAPYVAAKTGVLGLVRSAALEGAGAGIAVNAVAPGWIRTPLAENQLRDFQSRSGLDGAEALERFTDRQAVPRFVEPDEVANTVVFLASPAASGITGACVPVDLGLLAR